MSDIYEELAERNPEALTADGLEDAYIGFTVGVRGCVAVYDAEKCIDVLVKRDGMTPEGAEEFLEFNTFSAYVGENGPVYLKRVKK